MPDNSPAAPIVLDLSDVLPDDREQLTDFGRWCNVNAVCIRPWDFPNWRLTKPNPGNVTGFPHFGVCHIEATDGVVAYVRRTFTGKQLFQIHNCNFTGNISPLNSHANPKPYNSKPKQPRKPRKPARELADDESDTPRAPREVAPSLDDLFGRLDS